MGYVSSDLNVHLRRHDPELGAASVYFTAGYGRADALTADSEWCTIVGAGGKWQIPLLLRELREGMLEARSPYGYSGIYAHPELRIDDLTELWKESLVVLRAINVVSVFLRFSPYLSAIPAFDNLQGLSIKSLQPTVCVPTQDADATWVGMEGRARTAVRKAERLGMYFQIQVPRPEDKRLWDDFRSVYTTTMQRLNAANQYYFSESYYESLARLLDENLRIATVRNADGDVLAACIVMSDHRWAHYHLAGSTPHGARDGANNYMIWGVIKWASQQGLEALHLGGGVLPGDSLFKFKKSFGGVLSDFRVGRVVLNSTAYSRLVSRAALAQGVSTAQLEATGFFPAFYATVNGS